MHTKVRTYVFEVITGAGTAVMEPSVHRVHVEDTVRWVTGQGSLRVVIAPKQQEGIFFTRPGQKSDDPVDFDENTSRPAQGMVEGIAKLPGTYEHVAIVWLPQRPPVCTVAVLIIDP